MSVRLKACALLLLSVLVGCDAGTERDAASGTIVRLATTTSTHNSGLLDELIPPFQAATGYQVQVFAVGTGQALELGRRGDVDLVLVHARAREDAFVQDGFGMERRDIMWNDFVVLGPPADPAGVRGVATAVEAFRKIAAAGAPFVSRDDDSGTHIRERSIWREAGIDPEGSVPSYLRAGQGMGACLLMAFEKRAYILADRGTWLAYAARLDMDILVDGDAALRNPYGAILVRPDRAAAVDIEVTGARAFLDYLISPDGQRRIGAYRKQGQVLFHPAQGSD